MTEMSEIEKLEKLIADTQQHVRDGLLRRKEGARQIAQMKDRIYTLESMDRAAKKYAKALKRLADK